MNELIYAPISVGELFDKITILQIKLDEYTDKAKVILVIKELEELYKLSKAIEVSADDLMDAVEELKQVNKVIWDNEDLARTFPSDNLTDQQLMNLAKIARQTYDANTRRAQIKREINRKTNSVIVETKSYIEEN